MSQRSFLIIIFLTMSIGNALIAQHSSTDRTFVTIEVYGLSCPFCAYGLEKKLKSIKGADDIVISVKKGTATLSVPARSELTKLQLKKIVKEAGYSAKEITFTKKSVNDE